MVRRSIVERPRRSQRSHPRRFRLDDNCYDEAFRKVDEALSRVIQTTKDAVYSVLSEMNQEMRWSDADRAKITAALDQMDTMLEPLNILHNTLGDLQAAETDR